MKETGNLSTMPTNIQTIKGILPEPLCQNAKTLAELCCHTDGISLSYPTDPEDAHISHYLLSDQEGMLLSALALSFYGDETAECVAFTAPGHRRKGYFSALLQKALGEYPDCDLIFAVSGHCPHTMAVLDSLEATLQCQELQMELWLPSEEAKPDLFSFSSAPDPESGDTLWSLLQSDQTTIGTCRTLPISASSVCLHQVEIHPQYRCQGYGTILIRHLLSALQASGCSKVLLQVAGDNYAAVALYKKTGFRITETLSFYLY